MYNPIASKRMKYFMDTCRTEIKATREFMSVNENHYNIVLHSPESSILVGQTSIRYGPTDVKHETVALSNVNKKKSLAEKEMYLELMIRCFIKHAKQYNRQSITVLATDVVLMEVLSNLDFSINKPYDTNMCFYRCSLKIV